MRLKAFNHMVIQLAIVVMILFAGSVEAVAADVPNLLRNAEQQLAKKKPLKALQTVRSAVQMIWKQTPLSVSKAVLIQKKASGYGLFEPRSSNEYKPGEPIMMYMEPVGYTVEKKGDVFTFALRADMSVLDTEGNVLAGKKEFAHWSLESRNFSTEMYINIVYTIGGLKPGNYVFETALHDELDKSVTMISTPVVIISKRKKEPEPKTEPKPEPKPEVEMTPSKVQEFEMEEFESE